MADSVVGKSLWNRWIEFFEGAGNRLSMMRLTIFLSFWPASYVLIKQQTETMLGLYLGAYVAGFIGGKRADNVNNRASTQILETSTVRTDVSDGVLSGPLPDASGLASGDKPKSRSRRKHPY